MHPRHLPCDLLHTTTRRRRSSLNTSRRWQVSQSSGERQTLVTDTRRRRGVLLSLPAVLTLTFSQLASQKLFQPVLLLTKIQICLFSYYNTPCSFIDIILLLMITISIRVYFIINCMGTVLKDIGSHKFLRYITYHPGLQF